MSLIYADRVQETSTTTGTGTYTLAGAVLGYQSFAAVGNGNTCYYCAMGVDGNGNPNGDGWEVGLGTYTAAGTTLARTAVKASSNSNNAVNWAVGTRRIFLVAPALQPPIQYGGVCEGRLTTESDVPVSTTDRTGQGTLYWKPCTPRGKAKTNGVIDLWNGTDIVRVSLTQLSLALTISSGKNKNVYIDYNAGTPQIVLGVDWTNDTTESETLVDQNGLIVLSGTSAYRYVGYIRASGANVVEDSRAKRFVWNLFNQVPRQLYKEDTTATYNYTTNTWREANGGSNRVEWIGGAESFVTLITRSRHSNSTANISAGTAVGIDSTTTPSGVPGTNASGVGAGVNGFSEYAGYPGIGYHFAARLEAGGGSGTVTWYGAVTFGGVSSQYNAIEGVILG